MTGQVTVETPLSYVRGSEMVPGETLQQHYDRLGLEGRPVVCVMNGEPVLREDWSRPVDVSDTVQFIALPQGRSFKKILRIVALIALAVIAPVIAPSVAGFIGVTSAIGVSLVSAGIVLAGSFLINALLPPDSLKSSAAQGVSASPTYSRTAQGNVARLLEPIPRLYGRHLLYPDFASQPYLTYSGNDQYLYQLFCLGVGEYDVHEVRIEDTSLWTSGGGFSANFSDVQLEIIPPGSPVTLFPAAVVTSVEVSGQELLCLDDTRTVSFSGNRITMTTSGQKERLDFVAVGATLTITGAGANSGTRTVTATSGTGEWVDVGGAAFTTTAGVSCTLTTVQWVGPFVANPSDQATDKLQVDLIYQRGLYYANDDGGLTDFSVSVTVEARPIDSGGAPAGSWATLESFTMTGKNPTPLRVTRSYDVTVGRYEVRVRRTNNKKGDSRYANDVQWGGLRAFIPDDNTFADVTLMAVVIRASNQLSDASSRRFNTIQTAKVPAWTGSAWTAPTASRSPAWAVADMLRNTIYGAGLPDSRIDLAALLALDATWTARGDKFDGVFDRRATLWECLGQVLRVGRAQPLLIAGKVSFVRDEATSLSRGVLTPRNIIRGSLETTHILYDEDSPDAVLVEFMDERTWKSNEVLCKLAGSTEDNPARIQLFGVVNRTQAWREGMYQAAANLYRRVFATVSTEMEGRLLIRGDSVALSHDLVRWGQSAEVIGWTPATRELVLSEPVTGSPTVVGLSDRRGRLWGPVELDSVSADGFTLTLDATSLASVEGTSGAIPVYLEADEEPTRAMCGTLDTYARKFKVVSSRPDRSGTVQLVMTNDDPRVYSADSGSPPAEEDPYGPGTAPNAPLLTGLVLSQDPSSPSNPVLLNAGWNASPGATSYLVQASADGVTWTSVFSGTATTCQFTFEAGTVHLRAAALAALRGAWAYPTPNPRTFGTPSLSPGQVTNLTAAADTGAGVLTASWSAAPRATSYLVEVFSGALYDVLELTRTSGATSVLFTSTDVAAAGGPWSAVRVRVTPRNASGDGPVTQFTITGIGLPAPTAMALVTAYTGRDVNLQWTTVASASTYVLELREGGSTRATYTLVTNSILITATALAAAGGPWRSLEARVKAVNGALESGWLTLAIDDPAPAVPGSITTSSPSAGRVDVSWAASSGATVYVLYASPTNGFTPGPSNEAYRGTSLGVSITGLSSGSTLYMRLQAEDNYAGGDGFNISTQFSQLVT